MVQTQNGTVATGKISSDKLVKYLLTAVSLTAVLVLLSILFFMVMNSTGALSEVGLWNFVTGMEWRPSEELYGAGAILVGSLLVTLGALVFSVPIGIGAAIYMSEVASGKVRKVIKPVIELFAGIPSVVYGFFGLMVMIPFLSGLFPEQMPTGFAWLTGSILLGIMALPTIISISEDALGAVPRTYREASMAMGATRWETTSKVVIPVAVSGIASAVILGIGRAIGETMAVMMVTGNAAIVPEPFWNVFSFVRTITATLAIEMPEVVVGSTHYSALFLLCLILMVIVLAINVCARQVVKMVGKRVRGEAGIGCTRKLFGFKGSKKFKYAALAVLGFSAVDMICVLFMPVGSALVTATAITLLMISAGILLGKVSRKNRQTIMHSVLFLAVGSCIAILAIIIGDIVIKAIPAIDMDFLTQYPSDAGKSGGIFPAIIGTIEIIIGTAIIALPLGILSGTYLAEYSKGGKVSKIIEQAIDVLNGTPSIVFALFGMSALVITLGLGVSLISGCITLAFMILPVIIRTTKDAIGNVPREIREASYALGANKWQTTFKVVLPAAMGGIMTGAILGLGRAAGETAPVMFTAAVLMKYTVGISPSEPVMVLPYHLYYLATEGTADPSMQYATALVLLVIVLSMFLIANVIRERSKKYSKW